LVIGVQIDNLEAGVGFEPTNGGFANRNVKPLHHPAFFRFLAAPCPFGKPMVASDFIILSLMALTDASLFRITRALAPA
jgi:hypothetical protein